MVAILIFNVTTLVMTMLKKKDHLTDANLRNMIRVNTKLALTSSAVLGVAWLFGVLAVGHATLILQILFCLFAASQGFFVFLGYTLCEPIVKDKTPAW